MTASETLKQRPLQIVTCCRSRDLPVLRIAAHKLRETVPVRSLHVIAPDADCSLIGRELGSDVVVVPEDSFIPGMNRSQIRSFPGPLFPQTAGWYFQQLLKFQFAFQDPEDDYYLIWDADTIPLTPLRFFDDDGHMLLTKASEHHAPYFDTYQRMFREAADREFSFISQHMLVQKSIARDMLLKVRAWDPDPRGWAWNVLRSLPEHGCNLFSEYETYGHYVKRHYPERIRFVERPWLREGAEYTGGMVPSPGHLEQLARHYEYAAFERVHDSRRSLWKARIKRALRADKIRRVLPGR